MSSFTDRIDIINLACFGERLPRIDSVNFCMKNKDGCGEVVPYRKLLAINVLTVC